MSDPMKYRSKEEMEGAKLRDPIRVYGRRLRERGVVDDVVLERLEDEVEGVVKDAVGFAEESPNPCYGDRFEDLLAERYPFDGRLKRNE
jgi:pyruvate dehydrogenase E1 component alpha subunit